MKRIFLVAVFTGTILTGSKVFGQMVYQQKVWQNSISATIGPNYNGGVDFQGMYTLRINASPFFVSAGYAYGEEKTKISSYDEKNTDPTTASILQLSGAYSFFDKLSPAPFNIALFGGFINVNEKMKIQDNSIVDNNTFGNVFGAHFEWYFSRNVSLIARQNFFLLYSSPLGNTRGNTSVGISVNF